MHYTRRWSRDLRIFADAKDEVQERANRDGIRWGVYKSGAAGYIPVSEHDEAFEILDVVYVAEPEGRKDVCPTCGS
jgi:hypothetical protein